MNSVYFFGILIFLISCTGGDQQRGRIVHPQEKFLPLTKSVVRISDENPHFDQSDAAEYIRRLRNAKKAIKIGIEKGAREEMFGEIMGVISDTSGRVLILDSQYNEIKVFNKEGDFLFSFGRGGPGPGEFMSPEDIEMGKDGRVYIADRHNAIKIFEPKGSGFEYLTTIKIHIVPDAFCILQDKLFIRGIGINRADSDTTEFKTIHAYSAETGEYLYSFGEPYNSPNTFVLNQLSDGRIACNEATNMIISTFDTMPYLFGYTAEGTLSWSAKIENFSQRPIIQEVDNSIGLKSTDYKVHSIHFIVPVAKSEWFLVQVTERPTGRNMRLDEVKNKSYLISSENGSGGFIGYDLSNPVLYTNQRRLFANGLLSSSYPSVLIYDY